MPKFDDRTTCSVDFKFNHWGLRGVPFRLEAGPKDVKNNQALAARRGSAKSPRSNSRLLSRMSRDFWTLSKSFVHAFAVVEHVSDGAHGICHELGKWTSGRPIVVKWKRKGKGRSFNTEGMEGFIVELLIPGKELS